MKCVRLPALRDGLLVFVVIFTIPSRCSSSSSSPSSLFPHGHIHHCHSQFFTFSSFSFNPNLIFVHMLSLSQDFNSQGRMPIGVFVSDLNFSLLSTRSCYSTMAFLNTEEVHPCSSKILIFSARCLRSCVWRERE